MEVKRTPVPVRRLYRFIQFLFFLFYKIFYRLTFSGIEHIPESGGVIIASNHASLLDPPAIGSIIPREVSFFAKKELLAVPVVNWLIYYSNAIPVDRQGYPASALKEMIAILKNGGAVVAFPEGTRTKTGEFGKPKKGVGMAAVMADVPVVPCWIEGSFRAKPFVSQITVHFLPSFRPGEIDATTKKIHYLLVSEKIMHDITKLYKKAHGRA